MFTRELTLRAATLADLDEAGPELRAQLLRMTRAVLALPRRRTN